MVTKKTGWMVKIMNIAICDDERNFAKMLKDYISEYAAIHDFTNHVKLCFFGYRNAWDRWHRNRTATSPAV